MNESLQSSLHKLRLTGLMQTLDVRLQEAAGHNLTHMEFLELLVQDELAVRADRLIERRVKAAAFRDQRTIEDFDFSFNPSIKRKQIFDLAAGRFISEARDVLLLGPPGVGKSHLVQAIGYQAIKAGFTVLYADQQDRASQLLRSVGDPIVEANQSAEVGLSVDRPVTH